MPNGGFFKRTDTAYIKQNQADGQPIGEAVLIRRVSGRTAGNPAQGVQPTFIYKTLKTKAVIVRLSPDEINSSSGIYQYGDLRIDLLEELSFSDERTGEIGDRVVYQRQTYRVVGRTQNQNIEKTDVFFSYVVRKVGNDPTVKVRATILSDAAVI